MLADLMVLLRSKQGKQHLRFSKNRGVVGSVVWGLINLFRQKG